MFTDLATLREAVKDRLTPLLPADWACVPYLEGMSKALKPVWYIEYTAVESAVNGQELGEGQVAPSLNIIITDPKTDTQKAETAVDGHVLQVIRALDEFDDIYWTRIEKKRLEDGPMAWTFSVFALASTKE